VNALCGATAAAAFDDLLVVDLELLLPELVVDLELLLPELFALLLIVGEVEGLDEGANTSLVGAGVSSSLVGAGVSVSVGLGVAKGSGVGANGSEDGDGEEISEQQKAKTPVLIANEHNGLSEETCTAPS